MKKILIAAAVLTMSSTFASAQMMMNQGGPKMTQEQMNEMARAKPIPGAGYVSPPGSSMSMSSGSNMGMSSNMSCGMNHSMSHKMRRGKKMMMKHCM